MNKTQKRILTAILILALISIILIICITMPNDQQGKNVIENATENTIGNTQTGTTVNIDSKLRRVSNRDDFYIAQTCINKFYIYYQNLFDSEEDVLILDEEALESIKATKEKNMVAIYNMLDEEYINYKGITKENLEAKLAKISTAVIDINNMYVSEKTASISIYIADGTLREKETGKISNFQIMVKIDSSNRTFKVLLQDYINKKYANIKVGQDIDINIPKIIQKNDYNIYEFKDISDEEYVVDLFNKYKEEILFNQELVYNKLDNEYKQKKFKSLSEFKAFAKKNVNNSVIAKVEKYKKTDNDNYTQYVCIDQKGNYYIFRETEPMNYTIILDTYTIDLPEFIERYEKASNEDKALMNIQRFFDAISDKDYKYAYSKLDETYKTNKFKTQADFENYVKNTFFEKNKLAAGKAEKQGDIYLYNVTISDASEKDSKTVTTSFVMQLKEGTDFVMSFGVQ